MNDRAMAMTHDDVVTSMVPVCLDVARPLIAADWATVHETDAPDRDIAQACLAALEL